MTIGNYAPLVSYKMGCRCSECVTQTKKYDKGRRIDQARGISHLTTPERAIKHIEYLVNMGVSRRTIAASIGYTSDTGLNFLLKRNRIRTVTERKILAVKPNVELAHKGWVSAVGSRRKLQALAYMGWTLRYVCQQAHINNDTGSVIRLNKVTRIEERVASAIDNVYKELHMINGGDIRSHKKAIANGWMPPMAWDNIDDPDEEPKT